MALAQRLFEAYAAYGKIEDEVSVLLDRLYGYDAALHVDFDFTTDGYDESIEIYGCIPSTEAAAELRGYGFRLIWQHEHPIDGRSCKCSTHVSGT